MNKILALAMTICFLGGLFVMDVRHAHNDEVLANAQKIIELQKQVIQNKNDQIELINLIHKEPKTDADYARIEELLK